MSTTSHLHRSFKGASAKAGRVFDVIRSGGIAIIPVYAGYGVFGASDDALDRIFTAKRRAAHKVFTLVGDLALHRTAQVTEGVAEGLVDRVTGGLDLAFGVVAPLRPAHPLVARISSAAMAHSARDGRINMILNSGAIMDGLAALSRDESLPVFGTSANLSGLGLKGRVQDIEPPVLAAADLVVDEGPLPGYSSSIVDLGRQQTLRFGHRYAEVQAVARSEFGLDLPSAPPAHA